MARFVSSLRFRLIALVLLAVIPAFGVILYSASRHRQLIAHQAQASALGAARAIAAEQERFIETAHRFLIMLSQLPQVRAADKGSCGKSLAGLLEPLYADVILTDAKGNVLCSALPAGASLGRANGLDQARVSQTNDFSVGKVRTIPSLGKTIVGLSYPVLDSPGVLRAVVATALDLSWISRIAAENHLYHGATFTLVDENGVVLLRYPNGAEGIGRSLFAETPIEGVGPRDTEKAFESVGADGVPRLFGFSRLKSLTGDQTVYAAIDIPAALAFAEADRILFYNLVTLGALSLLTLLAAWFGADLFVLRRIRDLVSATNQVASGKLNARTQFPYGKSELGQMARAFDDLARTLEKREVEAQASAAQIQRQRLRQNALYDLNVAITSILDLATVLRTLLDQTSALFPSCAATVSLWNDQTGALEHIARRNLGATNGDETEAATEEGLPLLVFKHQSPLALANAQIDPRTTNPEFFRSHRLLSYLGLPLIAKEETLGVLSFYMQEEREFNPEEMNFLTALVNQAAIAIYNSRLYEQTRNQAVELDKSNKIKDEFLGVMSHELRTPLNIIMNYAEAFRMGMFGEINRDQKKCTEKMRVQAVHLLTLINGILEITKIESGSVTLQKEPFDLGDFLAESRSDYMMPIEKNLTLQWHYPPDLPTIVGDRIKLKQILTNLINNAIKFTDQGSVIVSAQALDRGHTLELEVTDTGPGIPEDMLPRVFDKFRQIDNTMTRNHSGAGLGLYIVKTFVELFEGTISVQSKVGEGSTFTVRLPIKRETGDFQPQAAARGLLN